MSGIPHNLNDTHTVWSNKMKYCIHTSCPDFGVGILFFQNEFTSAVNFDLAGRKNIHGHNILKVISELDAFKARLKYHQLPIREKKHIVGSDILDKGRNELLGVQNNPSDFIMHAPSTMIKSSKIESLYYELKATINSSPTIDFFREFLQNESGINYSLINEEYRLHKCLDFRLIIDEIAIQGKDANIAMKYASDVTWVEEKITISQEKAHRLKRKKKINRLITVLCLLATMYTVGLLIK